MTQTPENDNSDKLFSDILDALAEGIAITDMNLGITRINPSFTEITGLSEDEVIGRGLQETVFSIAEGISSDRLEPVFRKLEKGQPFKKLNIQTGERSLEISSSILKQHSRILVRIQDITETDSAKKNLSQIFTRHQALLKGLSELVFRFDRDAVIIDFNAPRDDENLYVSPKQFVGRKVHEVMPDHVSKAARQSISRVLEDGKPESIFYDLEMTGGLEHYEARFVPDGLGNVLAVVRNISELSRTRDKLQETLHRFRTFTERSQQGILIGSIENITDFYHNTAFAGIFGYTSKDIPDMMTWFQMVIPDAEDREEIREAFYKDIREHSDGSDIPDLELQTRHKDGRDLLIKIQRTISSDMLFATISDITGERLREKTLLAQLDISSYAEEHSEDEILSFALNRTAQILHSEKACFISETATAEGQKTLIYADSDMEGAISTVSSAEDLQLPPILMDCLTQGKELIHGGLDEVAGEDRDGAGKKTEVLAAAVPLIFQDKVLGAASVRGSVGPYDSNDLASLCAVSYTLFETLEKKRTKVRLENFQQTYRQILDSINEAVYIQDRTGTFIEVNRGAERIYRMDREELIGKTPADIAAPGMNDLDRIVKLTESVWETGFPVEFEFWAKRKSGESFSKDVIINKGSYFGEPALIATARENSERKKAEEERNSLAMQLSHAQKMESIGRLAGGVAHDFNNILQGMLSVSEILHAKMKPENGDHQLVSEIIRSAEKASDLTRQLLAFARKQTIKPVKLNLNRNIESMMKMLKRLIGENISIDWFPGADLKEVSMDPSQLDQILVNLAVNSKDAIDGLGRIVIRTENMTLSRDRKTDMGTIPAGQYVLLSFNDDGAGIDKQVLEHIFEPFFTTKGTGRGTGLGLATVYGIVEQNRGFIYVESRPGKGSTFKICLPQIETEDAGKETSVAMPVLEPGESLHILLVEDDIGVIRMVASTLRQLGYKVTKTTSPKEALDLARSSALPFDLLLTDVIMPEMNGRDLADRILLIHPNLPVLFMSGYPDEAISPNRVLDNRIHFIAKPFKKEDLGRILQQVLKT